MPSCTRAPPESLMKTKGLPVLSDMFHHVGDLVAMDLARSTAGDGEILTGKVDQPAVDWAQPVTTPSAGMLFPAIPNSVARCSANRAIS